MKHYFAEHTFAIRKFAKSAGISVRLFLAKTIQSLPKQVPQGSVYLPSNAQLLLQRLIIEGAFLVNGGSHYFVESEALAVWFKECAKSMPTEFFYSLLPEACRLNPVLVHTTGKDADAILFGIQRSLTGDVFIACGNDYAVCLPVAAPVPSSLLANEWFRQLAGMAAYLRAVPSALIPGLPAVARHPNHFSDAPCFKVAWQGGTHAKPCGHIRLSHPRKLISPVFTHKQGQTIQVNVSWVGPEFDLYTVTDKRQLLPSLTAA